MQQTLSRISASAGNALEKAGQRAARLSRRELAWGGLALGAIILLAVNLIASTAFRNVRVDLTKDRLFTISEGTRKALAAIDEPVSIRVYFSKKLGEAAPAYGKNFERVRALLERYRDLSNGKLRLTFLDPEPFSDAEDRAVAGGLRGVRLNQEGDTGYFGLIGTNATDNEAVIPFLTLERERFLEYDVTKLIHSLANPKKRVVGLLSTVPLEGGMSPMMGMGGGRPMPPQTIVEQIREFFDIKTLASDLKEIPNDIDVLMLVQPEGLPAEAAYAIDQYALKGGKVLAFVDPVGESWRMGPMAMMTPGGAKLGEFDKLLKAWGIAYDPGKVAADIAHARRVQFGGGQRPTITEYVAWLGLDQRNIDQGDVLSGGIERINMASAGVLNTAEGASTRVTPVLLTSAQSMQISSDRVSMMPDAVGLLRSYKAEGKPLMLVARISGEAKSAFPDGAPKPAAKEADGKKDAAKDKAGDEAKADEKKDAKPEVKQDAKAEPAAPAKPHAAAGNLNVILVADTDLLHDQFWVDVREFMGQQVQIPIAHNASFVLGALENLSGSDALISLRARGVSDRPFELVNALRRDAERRFRDKEQTLTAKLKEVQEQLAKLEKASGGDGVMLSDQDRAAIDKFRAELLTVRRELRDVKHELRKDIDRLDAVLKFANIAAVPLVVGFGGLGWAAYRRRRAASAQPGKTAS